MNEISNLIFGPWYFNYERHQTERMGSSLFYIYDYNGGCALYKDGKVFKHCTFIKQAQEIADFWLTINDYILIDDIKEWNKYKVLL